MMKVILRNWLDIDDMSIPTVHITDWNSWIRPSAIIDFIRDDNTDLDSI